jgi:DNA-binding winged helix-turn-helix (wHTH) protein
MSNPHKHFYEFEHFRLDPKERRLQRNGEVLSLTPKAFEVLMLLVENGGHALRKDEFLEKVWAGSYVEEKNLADNISLLRRILGDDPKSPLDVRHPALTTSRVEPAMDVLRSDPRFADLLRRVDRPQ